MILPKKYEWLLTENGPKMVLEFLKIYGTVEAPGEADNPVILDWAKETGLSGVYKHDAIAWCGLTMALLALRAGKQVPKNPLWALNWVNFGRKVSEPMLGDVLVFKRQGGGHVALYVGEDDVCYHCAGGNQGDAVNIVRKAKSRLYAVRRPIYNTQPPNVRKVFLSPDGAVDNREV